MKEMVFCCCNFQNLLEAIIFFLRVNCFESDGGNVKTCNLLKVSKFLKQFLVSLNASKITILIRIDAQDSDFRLFFWKN